MMATQAAVMLITLIETGFAPSGKDATFYLKITFFPPSFSLGLRYVKCSALTLK